MRNPTVEELAEALREYPSWGHAYVAAKDEMLDLRRLIAAALRYDGHLADCPQDGPCEALCQDFRAALSEEPR